MSAENESFTASPEAQLPRVEDVAVGDQTYAAGNTPTRSGDWVVPLLIKVDQNEL